MKRKPCDLARRLHFWHVQRMCVVRPIPLCYEQRRSSVQCHLLPAPPPSPHVSLQPPPTPPTSPTIASCNARQGKGKGRVMPRWRAHFQTASQNIFDIWWSAWLAMHITTYSTMLKYSYMTTRSTIRCTPLHWQTQNENQNEKIGKGKKRTCVHLSLLPSTSSWLPTMYVTKVGERKETKHWCHVFI